MNDEIEIHVANLKSISAAPVPVYASDQFHRYFWLPTSQVPACIKNDLATPPNQISDYESGCKEIERYWKKLKPQAASDVSSCSPVIKSDSIHLDQWRKFSKRDNVSRLLIDPLVSPTLPSSLYRSTFGTKDQQHAIITMTKQHHIRSSAITKYSERL